MINRRDMLKTTGLFAVSPLAFQQQSKQLVLDKSKDQNIFFGRNIKRQFNNINLKPWLQKCNDLNITTVWQNSWKFERGELDFPDTTPPETELRLNYPNYSFEFISLDKTWYASHESYSQNNLPPINGIHILGSSSYRRDYYIELDNVKFVSCLYMKNCKVEQ